MGYRHMVFDLDGTLIDSEQAILYSFQDALRSVTGRLYPLEELTFSLGIPGIAALEQLQVPDPDGTLALWEELILRKYSHLVHLFPEVPELLRALKERGIGLGVATSKTRQEMEFDFIPLGLAPYFPVTVSATDTLRHKPEPDPLLKYMELAKAAPEQILYIGDSPYDARCAHGAGIDFALATWGCRGRQIPAEYAPAAPLELLELL